MPPSEKRQRIYLSPSPEMRERLEQWAAKEKRPVANMATYLVESAIEAAIADGTIPEAPLESEAASGELEGDRAIRSVLRKIALGEQPSPGEVAIASAELDVDPNELMRRSRKAKEGNGGAVNC